LSFPNEPAARIAAGAKNYFFAGASGDTIFASRKNLADSSGGVGLM